VLLGGGVTVVSQRASRESAFDVVYQSNDGFQVAFDAQDNLKEIDSETRFGMTT